MLVSPLDSSPERLHSVKSSPLRLPSLNHPPPTHTTTTTIYTPLSQVLKHSFIKSALTLGVSANMKIHEAVGCGDTEEGEVIYSPKCFLPPEPLMQYCEEQAACVNTFQWGNINGAVREMTGGGAFLERKQQEVTRARLLCMCGHGRAPQQKKKLNLSSAHKQNLHNSFQFFHYSSWGGSCNWIFSLLLSFPTN